ncbi:UvrD-helicase domain-containing protein [Terrabacter sp. MAHUQ-38]|uniref:UvrD-helicase domain-containing protein n=1 Tax=unclassified Terrabacter TaxID=2630222 RepID=UPI00165E38F1|nr:ATP-dependent helicase [Terrabacter sp. MAHUQ-38]MBC9822846.1 ATP-dependent helicase [Terrabacter sp. MAHUQ-38]
MTQQIDPQRLAAATEQPNLLVIAPPGCGKTELLALRAMELIPRLAPHQRILALTFTNRAKANLGDRLRRHLGRERFRRYVAVHNFHGHAAEVVLAHGRTVGLPVEDLKMPTTKTLRTALAAVSNDAASRDAASQVLAKTKRAPLSDEEVLAALSAPGNELAKRVELNRILANELHYEDLLRHAQRLLNIDEVANLYRQHFGAVLVDEFQDLSPQQLAIALATCAKSRTFVGDPLQGIYSWAGAEPAQVEAQLREICGEPVPLTVSYRSSPNVLTMLNGVSGRLGAAPLEAADPDAWPDGGASSVLRFPTKNDEATFVAALSAQIVKADPTASVGVIARAGWRRREIDQAFAGMTDVPCRHWDLAIEDPDILERIRVAVAGMPKTISFDHARERIVATIDPSDVDTIEQIEDAFVQLQAGGATGVRSALQRFRVREDDAPIEPGVHLLNAHTGKGQQFDWVFIPGLEEGHLPGRRSNQGPALAEEERVLLVMLSRAKHGVVATYAQTLDGRFGRYASTPCRWLAGLAASAAMNWPQLEAHLHEHYPQQPSSA